MCDFKVMAKGDRVRVVGIEIERVPETLKKINVGDEGVFDGYAINTGGKFCRVRFDEDVIVFRADEIQQI